MRPSEASRSPSLVTFTVNCPILPALAAGEGRSKRHRSKSAKWRSLGSCCSRRWKGGQTSWKAWSKGRCLQATGACRAGWGGGRHTLCQAHAEGKAGAGAGRLKGLSLSPVRAQAGCGLPPADMPLKRAGSKAIMLEALTLVNLKICKHN